MTWKKSKGIWRAKERGYRYSVVPSRSPGRWQVAIETPDGLGESRETWATVDEAKADAERVEVLLAAAFAAWFAEQYADQLAGRKPWYVMIPCPGDTTP